MLILIIGSPHNYCIDFSRVFTLLSIEGEVPPVTVHIICVTIDT